MENVTFEQIKIEFMSGVEAINVQNYLKAITAFQRTLDLLKISGSNDLELISSCHYNMGEAYKNSNRLVDAINSFSSAIEIKNTNEDAYLGLSDCYFMLETNEGLNKVIQVLSKCILLFPNKY